MLRLNNLALALATLLVAYACQAQAVIIYEGDNIVHDENGDKINPIHNNEELKPPLPPAPPQDTAPQNLAPQQPERLAAPVAPVVPRVYMGIAAMAPIIPNDQFGEAAFIPQQQLSLVEVIQRYNKKVDPELAGKISDAIHAYGGVYQVDVKLLASLVAVESSFRCDAVSSSGAIGLGQLKPDTAKWLGVVDPFDPVQNLSGVAKYMRYLLNHYNGNTSMALAAYYKGQGNIDKNGVDEDANGYVDKISRALNKLF